MKKSLLNLGRVLHSTEKKQIKGGSGVITHEGDQCTDNGDGAPNGCPCVSDTQCGSKICELERPNIHSGICVQDRKWENQY